MMVTVGIWADRALRESQCILKGETRYVNIHGSIHWEGVYSVGRCNWRCNLFELMIKIDQSETTKSYMFNTLLRWIDHK